MTIIEDTGQKIGQHTNISDWCAEHGVTLRRQKLNVGDYQIAGQGGIAVDTKMSVLELAMNVFQDHARFRDECERAQRSGIQLIVLTEESLPGGRLENWVAPIGRDDLPVARFDPRILKKAMISMQEKYGVKFRFCDGRSTGRVLFDYLTGVLQ